MYQNGQKSYVLGEPPYRKVNKSNVAIKNNKKTTAQRGNYAEAINIDGTRSKAHEPSGCYSYCQHNNRIMLNGAMVMAKLQLQRRLILRTNQQRLKEARHGRCQ